MYDCRNSFVRIELNILFYRMGESIQMLIFGTVSERLKNFNESAI
jgi:hypothetical protein